MSAAIPSPTKHRSRLLGPAPLLVAGTLAAWTLPALFPRLLILLGFDVTEKWFLDSYAILAACDARRAGLDPMKPNPLDLLHRPHCYSDWWFALQSLGLTRADNFLVGLSWVAAFLVVAILVLSVRNDREAFIGWAFLAAPPVLLAVMRGNNDLVIFVLVGVAALLLRKDSTPRVVAAGLLVALAAGLKFYPVVAGAFVLLVRPRGRLALNLAIVGALLALVMVDVGSTVSRGDFPIPIDMHKSGVPVLLSDLGLVGRAWQAAAAALLGIAGFVLGRRQWTTGLDASEPEGRGPRYAFVLGAALLAACFVAGVSHAYRWIFSLLLLPWLLAMSGTQRRGSSGRRAAQWTLGLLLFVSWADGVFCLLLNVFWTPQPVPAVEHVEWVWRLCTQPLQWVLMVLLAGWLWNAALDAGRTLRGVPARHPV